MSWFGVGISHGKTVENLGTLWRTANTLGAAFIFTIGDRYKSHPTDTTNAPGNIPYWRFDDVQELKKAFGAPLVGVELDPRAKSIKQYQHHERAIYLLGAEDRGLTREEANACHELIVLPGNRSVNVAVAGSVVLFDRVIKQ